MRFPVLPRRRARGAVDAVAAVLRIQLDDARATAAAERTGRLQAEAHARTLDQRMYELTLASQLHDQQLHAKEAE